MRGNRFNISIIHIPFYHMIYVIIIYVITLLVNIYIQNKQNDEIKKKNCQQTFRIGKKTRHSFISADIHKHKYRIASRANTYVTIHMLPREPVLPVKTF